jgi:hypothetical protein
MGKQVTRAAGTVWQEVATRGFLAWVVHVQFLAAKHHVRQVLHSNPLNDSPCKGCEVQQATEQQNNMNEIMVAYKKHIK